MKQKQYKLLLVVLLLLPFVIVAQESVLRLVPYNGQESSFLNAQLIADTTANNGIPANRVYELQRGKLYLSKGLFQVNKQYRLRIRANDSTGSRPAILLYPTGSGATPQNPPGQMFQLNGGDIELKSIVISGYFEPIDSNINNLQGGLINTNGAGSSMYIDDCVVTQSNGNHLRTESATLVVKVTNSIFADMGFLGRSNLGAGKAIDMREASCDSLIFVNNTFVNFQDRIIRHYNFGNPTAGTGAIGYTLFDHNTIVNGMSYHGLLSLGDVGKKVIITNNLFIDPNSLGEDSSDATRKAEWANTGEKYPNGTNRMTWIFSAPNDSTQWVVKNNYYSISDSGQAFINYSSSIFPGKVLGYGSPLSWHINKRLGADSATAFIKTTNPVVLTKIPKLMTDLCRWYISPTGGNKLKNTPTSAWVRSLHDFDRKRYQYWNDTLNATYSTSLPIYTADRGLFPIGDLNWYPSKKAQWLVTSVKQIQSVTPNAFSLDQNYPNPFNPSTTIKYQIPLNGMVSLKVYNLIGQEVASLVNDMQTAASYETSFDASKLSSGIYFYTLRAGNFVETKKMMLLK
ncbi:MAG TPA: hypothetical protein DCQ28_00655 [Bacteroidetes bacterium]|nr:hypothetical protein [Bacteroidota bacterium]